MMSSVVSVRGLRKSFGETEVLRGIDLDVERGEVVCVIGPSGSGKSTLLRCVNLLETPTGGSVTVLGSELTDIDGQTAVLFVMVVAAAEVVVGLGIVVAIMRRRQQVTADDLVDLKG